MALATETTSIVGYSPTATPVLDVVRRAPSSRPGKLTSGEYFFLSSVLISSLIALPWLRRSLAESGSASSHSWKLALSAALALGIAFLVHEVGHLIAGLAVGFRFSRAALAGSEIQQGLFGSRILRFAHFHRTKFDNICGRLIAIYASGPLAGLAFAVALEMARDWTQSAPLTQFRVHLISLFSLLISLSALLPDISRKGQFSDGGRLVALLKKDEQATRLLSILQMQHGLLHGGSPKDWAEGLITSATSLDDASRDSVAAHWLAYLWACDRHDITSATKHLEAALNAPSACSAALRRRLFLEAAIFQAWFRDNADKARSWVELINQGKLSVAERQRLQIALLWADGKLFDAFEKLTAHLQSLETTPFCCSGQLSKSSALEWKRQMESRMLTRAWRAMYTISRQLESSPEEKSVGETSTQLSSC